MIKTVYPPIFELLGPEDSGKSTVAELFLEALPADCHVMLISADAQSDLAKQLGLEPSLTLANVLEQAKETPLKLDSPEIMDWLMTELVLDVSLSLDKLNQELLCLGPLPTQLSQNEQALLDFALPRVFQHAQLIIADGNIDILKPSLKNFDIKPLLVIRPEDEEYCSVYNQTHFNAPNSTITTIQCILSKASGEDMPPKSVLAQIQAGNWTLLGKIPRLPSPGEYSDPVQTAFHDCLRRLDLSWQV